MSDAPQSRLSAFVLILLGLGFILAFDKVGEYHYMDFQLDLGDHQGPAPLYLRFVAFWALFGLSSAACLTGGITSLIASRTDQEKRPWIDRGSDRRWILATAALAFLIPVAIRFFVLEGAPLTDDETCYRFSAELLANFQLTTESPAHKLFFDHVFMINDGRMYSQYFLGWPALMVPGIWLGIDGYMNAIYCALTVAPLYWTAKRLSGPLAARLAVLVFLSSPMLMIGAATMLSHTSCMFALTWTVWLALRSTDEDSPWWHSTLFAVFFCTAFFNRPLTATAIGAPMLIVWLRGTWRSKQSRRSFISFLVPAVVFGGLFLTVNVILNGSPLRISYAAAIDYARSNQWRFTHWGDHTRLSISFLDISLYAKGLASNGLAFFRLNASSFGWPASLLFLPLAWQARRVAALWWMFALFMLLHLTVAAVGIDSFGPVHYLELALPMLLLTGIGVARLTTLLTDLPPHIARYRRAPVIAVCVMITLSLVAFTPRRLAGVANIAERGNGALQAPEKAGLKNAIVFVHQGLNLCHQKPPRGFLFQRPNNDIHHRNSVLWANHLTVEKDRLLMTAYPERTGYILWWVGADCQAVFIPITETSDDKIPPGVPANYDLSDA